MRIAYDTTVLSSYRRSGVYVYTYCLLQALLELDHQNTYQLFQHNAYSSSPFDYGEFASPRVTLLQIGSRPGASTEVGAQPRLHGVYKLAPYVVNNVLLHTMAVRYQEWCIQRALSADIVHASEYFLIKGKHQASVITVCDITTVLFPQHHTQANVHVHRRKLAFARERADMVIAISEATKRDLVERIKVPEQRITVVPGAARPLFMQPSSPEEQEGIRRMYGLDRPYTLFVGSIEPRKNLSRLLDAYAVLAADRAAGDSLLVIIGAEGWGESPRAGRQSDQHLAGRIRWLGFVPDEHLRHLYAGAQCFVYPSLYEGFGLPILEAMASGCPVITSTTSSMPEVAGDAALLIDPENTDALAGALARLLADEALRTRLSTAGRARAHAFSWQSAAAETLRLYESVYRCRHQLSRSQPA